MASVSKRSQKYSREKSNISSSTISTSSFQKTTVEKLRKLTEYEDYGENQLATEAKDLTNPQCIMDVHFSIIVYEPVSVRVDEKINEPRMEFLTSEESEASERRSKWRVEDTAKLEVKLLLRSINAGQSGLTGALASLFRMDYGPLHASLLINNQVLLDWNTSSLVIPERYDRTNREYPMVTSVLHRENSIAIQRYDPKDEIDLIFQATRSKVDLLNALIQVISRYNRTYYYHPIYRNCQRFVVDALEAMGCENAPQFKGNLAAYFEKLKVGSPQLNFRSHAELDEYTKANVTRKTEETQELSSQDKEYLLAQYFQYHMREISGSQNPDQWQCTEENCQMKDLDRHIDDQAMVLHQFLQTENS